jgi:hypothetical protein
VNNRLPHQNLAMQYRFQPTAQTNEINKNQNNNNNNNNNNIVFTVKCVCIPDCTQGG